MATATARRKVTAPSHVPPELVRDFDYLRDPEFLKDPFANLDKFRDTRVFWTACDGGSWVLTRAEDIQEAFRRPELFSNSTPILRLIAVTKALIPVGLDPPEHGKYRRVIAPRFFPKVIANLREGMTKTCVDLIESFLKKGKCDFVTDFAGLFPTTVFMRLLGLPLEHSAQFLEWEEGLLHADNRQTVERARDGVSAYLRTLIDERSARPTTDLVSELLGSKVDGRPVSKDEALDFCMLLFMAGLDTVTAALGLIFQYLAKHPDVRRELINHPERLSDAVEELLRLHAPVSTQRVVIHDTEFAGVKMKEGDVLLLATGFAARDPDWFPDPAHALLDRSINNHTVFGTGPHVCLGIHLARLEIKVALTEWLKRIPDFSISPGTQISFRGGGVLSLTTLPLEWSTSE